MEAQTVQIPQWNFGAEALYHGRSGESVVLYPGSDFFAGTLSARRKGPSFNLDTQLSVDRRSTFFGLSPSWQIDLGSPTHRLEMGLGLEASGHQYAFETGANDIEEATGEKINVHLTDQLQLDFGTLRTSLNYALAFFHFQQIGAPIWAIRRSSRDD